jgi:hypothetical protein
MAACRAGVRLSVDVNTQYGDVIAGLAPVVRGQQALADRRSEARLLFRRGRLLKCMFDIDTQHGPKGAGGEELRTGALRCAGTGLCRPPS